MSVTVDCMISVTWESGYNERASVSFHTKRHGRLARKQNRIGDERDAPARASRPSPLRSLSPSFFPSLRKIAK